MASQEEVLEKLRVQIADELGKSAIYKRTSLELRGLKEELAESR